MGMTVDGKTQLFGLIGNPVEHTLSPLIHNNLAKHLNMNMIYVPFHVPKGKLKEAVEGAKALNIRGLNVTIPYKVEIMDKLDNVTELARQAGAVNTIDNNGLQMTGYNTDIEGLKRCLEKNHIPMKNRHVVIIGAGGAAKAAAILCANEDAKRITIINRTYEKALILQEQVKKYYSIPMNILGYDELAQLNDFDVAIQSTSLGMYPKENNNPITQDQFYQNCKYAVDLIYNPAKTQFLRKAEENGCQIVNGLEMLFYQGVKAFEIWHNITINDSILELVLNQLKDAIY